MTNIVMIPKNLKVERPIALTSFIYRAWNKHRKAEVQKWQLFFDMVMPGLGIMQRRTGIASRLQLAAC